MFSSRDLYLRGVHTLVASWEAYAGGSETAAVIRSPGVAAAVFPCEPARAVYNNALLERDLAPAERAAALAAMEAAYAAAGVKRFAAWVHESDAALREDVLARGYTLDTSTRAMGMQLADLRVPRPAIALAAASWAEHERVGELPGGLLDGVDDDGFQVLVAELDGESVATGIALDRYGDCGIYNVGTLAHARRRGLGTAVTARLAHDAAARGCRTASLQSTPMAEGVYAAVGFRDLGRILEFVQPSARSSQTRSRSPIPSAVRPAA
jgi:ribosomal protein S18 acetylase RimI-like enzyme